MLVGGCLGLGLDLYMAPVCSCWVAGDLCLSLSVSVTVSVSDCGCGCGFRCGCGCGCGHGLGCGCGSQFGSGFRSGSALETLSISGSGRWDMYYGEFESWYGSPFG